MYGAFIGDIVGSKYEFDNIKTKDFPLFSQGCDYTDDTIMTTAVAKAIILSRQEQFDKGGKEKGFQDFLVEVMQDFGRRYPNPTGAYGGNFAKWICAENPKPYGSYGNGSAMRVSPCGLVAVTIDEALALARASACVTHDHPEGVKGAEAVSAAIFLAKTGKTKEEIKQYISEHYYDLSFTLDSIRDSYSFDGSCQGSVPQAIVAFLESNSFEDAIRNVISIGGDCDTTGAITGSIAWVYYIVQGGGYTDWANNKFSSEMFKILMQALVYIPEEFANVAEEFHELCLRRAGTCERTGTCTSILNKEETNKFSTDWEKTTTTLNKNFDVGISQELRERMIKFCNKYIVLMELLYKDKELNEWCRNYSAYTPNEKHHKLESIIYNEFMHEAYSTFMSRYRAEKNESESEHTEAGIIRAMTTAIRFDYWCNGGLINSSIASGQLYRLMEKYLSIAQQQ